MYTIDWSTKLPNAVLHASSHHEDGCKYSAEEHWMLWYCLQQLWSLNSSRNTPPSPPFFSKGILSNLPDDPPHVFTNFLYLAATWAYSVGAVAIKTTMPPTNHKKVQIRLNTWFRKKYANKRFTHQNGSCALPEPGKNAPRPGTSITISASMLFPRQETSSEYKTESKSRWTDIWCHFRCHFR